MSIEDVTAAFVMQLALRGFTGSGNLILLTDNAYQCLNTDRGAVFGSTEDKHLYEDRKKDLVGLLDDPHLVGIMALDRNVQGDLQSMGKVIQDGRFFTYQRDGRNYMILG